MNNRTKIETGRDRHRIRMRFAPSNWLRSYRLQAGDTK
jgi:hypothetical protein